jgi:ABC-type transport system substrate-binding protein
VSKPLSSKVLQKIHIFEGLHEFDYLANPAKVVPNTTEANTTEAMPAITDGGRKWTIGLKTGIRFSDDPTFKGKPRELVAEDYVYALKRRLDPNLRSGGESRTHCSDDRNYRSGLLWRLMRNCPYLVTGLRRAGFTGGWL